MGGNVIDVFIILLVAFVSILTVVFWVYLLRFILIRLRQRRDGVMGSSSSMNYSGQNTGDGSTCTLASHEWTPNQHRFLYGVSENVDNESMKAQHDLAIEREQFMKRLTDQLTGMETRMSHESESGFLSIAPSRDIVEELKEPPPVVIPRFLTLLDIPHVEPRKESFGQQVVNDVLNTPTVCTETGGDVLPVSVC
jgi:hypothetical protein